MCGIFGFYSKKNFKKIKELIYHLKKLEYRGYDSSGIFFKKNNNYKLIKLMFLLSISLRDLFLDPSKSIAFVALRIT